MLTKISLKSLTIWFYRSGLLQPESSKKENKASNFLYMHFGPESLFAMAQIRRIGHDHQAPFLPWPRSEGSAMTIRHPFCHGPDPQDRPWPSVTLFLVLLGFQAWHEAKTSCHTNNIPLTPQYFYRFWIPYKMTTRGSQWEVPPTPLTPPIGGGQNVFRGVMTDGPFWPQ